MEKDNEEWIDEPIKLGIRPGNRISDVGDIGYWRNVYELKKTPILCIKNKHFLSAAKLIYSGIDNLSWLTRQHNKPDVEYNDFILFTDTYLLPDSGLTCNSNELYSARCGLLHCNIAESGISRSGKSRHIIYAFDNAPEEKGYDHIRPELRNKCVVIHIDKLNQAFQKSIDRLNQTIAKEPDFADIIYKRSVKLYSWITN